MLRWHEYKVPKLVHPGSLAVPVTPKTNLRYFFGVVFLVSVFLSVASGSSLSAPGLAALDLEPLVVLEFFAVFPSAGPSGLAPVISSDSD